jgi:hypothetical protein
MASKLFSIAFLLAAPVILLATAGAPNNDPPVDGSDATLTACQGGGTAYCWQNFAWSTTPSPSYFQKYKLVPQANPTELRITDAFAGGDMFTVNVSCTGGDCGSDGTITLRTSLVPQTVWTAEAYLPGTYYATTVWNDPDAAWVSSYHSKLSLWLLPNCEYTIKIALLQTAISGTTQLNGGRAYIRAEYYLTDGHNNILAPSGEAGIVLPGDSAHLAKSHVAASGSSLPLDVNGRRVSPTLK